ncbi:hypothetical protein B296_00057493 [Ensete ventricosum]|uniref:Uncharacterized protein n=1 Tax=Ensete ventricosum TaxID=4639 RepID=A0A426WZJ1_ENSVE|nr:hypothetical protein B296_00057493 [Ensete ventricosum]
MGNCLAPESTRTKSRPRCAVAPRGLQVNEQEKRQPLQAAHEPRKRVKGTPERPKRSVRFEDYDGGKKEVVRVKIVMVKKEAARFLTMLAAGDDGASKEMQCELEGAQPHRRNGLLETGA